MNIPARYCTGYLGDVGTPLLSLRAISLRVRGLDRRPLAHIRPRNNMPRASRILMARGRDASDVAIATTFGPNMLESFRVWTDEIPGVA